MRAILINPTAKTVEEVETPAKLRDIYQLLGCDCITSVRLTSTDIVYVDDEGLLKPEPGPYFKWVTYEQPLAGNGLILGFNRSGDECSTTLELSFVRRYVSWPKLKLRGFDEFSGDVDSVFGPTFMIRRTPRFTQD